MFLEHDFGFSIYVACKSFAGAGYLDIMGFFRKNGVSKLMECNVIHNFKKPYAIIRCVCQEEHDLVMAACGKESFANVLGQIDTLRPRPFKGRKP